VHRGRSQTKTNKPRRPSWHLRRCLGSRMPDVDCRHYGHTVLYCNPQTQLTQPRRSGRQETPRAATIVIKALRTFRKWPSRRAGSSGAFFKFQCGWCECELALSRGTEPLSPVDCMTDGAWQWSHHLTLLSFFLSFYLEFQCHHVLRRFFMM
jgi:hypothetical protein